MALSPIVAQAILGQRAPDIVGQFQAGQEQRQQREALQRQQQAQQLTGQFLQQQLPPELAQLAAGGVPVEAVFELGRGLGFDITDAQKQATLTGKLQQLGGPIQAARGLAKTNPDAAIDLLQNARNQLALTGEDAPALATFDQFLADARANPGELVGDLDDLGLVFERLKLADPISIEEGRPEKETQAQVNVLRKSIDAELKAFNQVEQANNRVKKVGGKATPASDLALIFNFMKMLDPGSVVRESEFKTAEDAKAWLFRSEEADIPIPAPIANFIRRAQEGTLLEDTQRLDFLNQASSLFDAARESADVQLERILGRADVDKIKRKRVIGAKSLGSLRKRQAEREQPAAPTTLEGTTEAGLRDLSDEQLAQLAGGQ